MQLLESEQSDGKPTSAQASDSVDVVRENKDDDGDIYFIPDAFAPTPTKKHELVPVLQIPSPLSRPVTPPPQPIIIKGIRE